MTLYRASDSYRSSSAYRGRSGVYTTPPLSRMCAVGARNASPKGRAVGAPWAATAEMDRVASIAWYAGQPLPLIASLPWGKPIATDGAAALAWQPAAPLDPAARLDWGKAIATDGAPAALAWQPGTPIGTLRDSLLPWLEVWPLLRDSSARWRRIGHQLAPITYRSWNGYRAARRYGSMRGQDAALDGLVNANWLASTSTDQTNHLPWGAGTRMWPEPTEAVWPSDTSLPGTPPPEPDPEDAYSMATDLTVTTFDPENPDAPGTPLQVDGVTIALDIDSFAWSLSCRVLDAASMALCLPPALVKVSTMGYDFVFLCERYSTTHAIGSTWQLSGSSQTRMLDKPWSVADSHLETNAINFTQACEACLPADFSIDWDAGIDDWTIPAKGWSFTNLTPKAALAELLTAAGLVMIPDLAAKKLLVQPRYKRAPWEYAIGDPDAIIADAMVLSESGEYQPGDTVNGVWISGTNENGVIVEVTRSGTAGDQLAPDQQHDAITDAVAGQQWGKQIIAASGNKTLVTFETIITDEMESPGLLLPGMIVEVQTVLENWRGLVLSTSIANPGSPRITQTVTIERSGAAALS